MTLCISIYIRRRVATEGCVCCAAHAPVYPCSDISQFLFYTHIQVSQLKPALVLLATDKLHLHFSVDMEEGTCAWVGSGRSGRFMRIITVHYQKHADKRN